MKAMVKIGGEHNLRRRNVNSVTKVLERQPQTIFDVLSD